MNEVAILQVVVDPSKAQSGAAEVERAVGSMANSATSFLGRMNAGFQGMISFIEKATSSLLGLFGVMAGGYAIKSMLDRMIDVNLVYNSFIATMIMVKGSSQAAQAEFQYLANYSDKMGASIEDTTNVYGKLAAALKEFDKSGGATRHIFESISQAQAVLHLKGYETNGIFLAMEQIVSKGKVSLEELQKQLGNRLPDAMGVTARAMGVTQAELRTSITKGSIDPLELVLKLANQIKIEYGDSAKSAADMFNAQVMRMKNSIFNLYLAIGQSGAMDGLGKIVKAITSMLQDPNTGKAFGEALDTLFSGIANWISTIKAEDIKDVFDGIGVMIKTVVSLFKDLGAMFSSTSASGKNDILDMVDGMASVFIILTDMVLTFVSALLAIPMAVNAMVYDVRVVAKKADVVGRVMDPNYAKDLATLEADRAKAVGLSDKNDSILFMTDESPTVKAMKNKDAMFAKLRESRKLDSSKGFSDAGFDAKQSLGRPLTDSEIAMYAAEGPGAPTGKSGKKGRQHDAFNTESTNLTKLASVAMMEYNNLMDNKVKSENQNLTALNAKIITDKNYIALSETKKTKLRELAVEADRAQLLERSAESFSNTRLDLNKQIYSSEQSLLDITQHRDALATKNQSTLQEKFRFDSVYIAMSSDMKNSLLDQAKAADVLAVAIRNAQVVEQSRYSTMVNTIQTQRDLDSLSSGKGRTQFNEANKTSDSFLQGGSNQSATIEDKSRLMADAVIRDANAMKLALGDVFDPAKAENFGNILKASMGPVGTAITDMLTAFDNVRSKNLEVAKEREMANKSYAADSKELASVIMKINEKEAKNRISSYGDMAGAAKGFFKESSTGYKALEAAQKVFQMAELAMAVSNFATKIGLTTAFTAAHATAKASEVALTTATLAPTIAVETSKQGVYGITALVAALGAPWPANFVSFAIVGAMLAALGVAVGGAGGGVSAPDPNSAAEVQKSQGTGTVFGDSTAKSDSIEKSLEMLENYGEIELSKTSDMLTALRSIDAAMAGLANIVVRTAGLRDGSNMNIKTGTVGRPTGLTNQDIILTSILNPITAIGMALAKVWGKTTVAITDRGLQVGGSVGDLQRGQGVNQYANVATTTTSWFGLKKNTSNSIQTQAVSADAANQFAMIFKNLQTVLTTAAVGLGKDKDVVSKAIEDFVLTTTKVSFQGMKSDEIEKTIQNVISGAMDSIARSVFPNLDKFAKMGEGYTETVIRISSETIIINETMTDLGHKLFEVNTSGIEASQALVTLFGGMDKLKSATTAYYEQFYSTQERTKNTLGNLSKSFESLGLAMPVTRADFRAEVEKANAAGNTELYASLIKLAPVFADLVPSIAGFAQSASEIAKSRSDMTLEIMELEGNSTGALTIRRQMELDAMDASLRPLQIRINTLKDEAAATLRASELSRFSTNQDIQILDLKGDKLGALNLRRQEELKSMDASLRPKQLEIYALQDKAVADQAAAAAAQQALQASNAAASAAASAAAQMTAAWQSVADSLIGEVNRIRGVISASGPTGFAAAQANFELTTAKARGGDQDAAKLLPGLSQAFLASAEGNSRNLFELNGYRASTASSLVDTAKTMKQYGVSIPGFATGGDTNGLSWVGEHGRELVATGAARVYTASQSRDIVQGGSNDVIDKVVKAINDLTVEVSKQSTNIKNIDLQTRKLKENIQRVTKDGDGPIYTSTTP